MFNLYINIFGIFYINLEFITFRLPCRFSLSFVLLTVFLTGTILLLLLLAIGGLHSYYSFLQINISETHSLSKIQ